MTQLRKTAILIAAFITVGRAHAKVEFNRDIRPILSDTCFHCHGPDEKERKSGLRLDVRAEALKPAKSGSVAIVPGKPDQSELMARVLTSDEDDLMPPTKLHKPLSSQQKDLLRQWIAEGAEYQGHWAFITPKRPEVPKVATHAAQVANDVDAFVFAKLEQEGLGPSVAADKATLIRRVTLDLTGLPPTPAEVDAFLADASPGRLREGGGPPARLAALRRADGDGTGSTPPATPTATASRPTAAATCGRGATG